MKETIILFLALLLNTTVGWRSMMMVDQTAVIEFDVDENFRRYRVLAGNPVQGTALVALAVDYENNRFFVSVYSGNTTECSILRMSYDSTDWDSTAWNGTHILHGTCAEGLAYSDGRLYGTDATQDYVFSCLPDGYDFQEIVNASDKTTPRGIIVSDGYVYWTEYLKSESDWALDLASGGIFRLPLSGNGDRESLIDGIRLKHPNGIDINGGFLFWADAGIDQIGMVDLTTKRNTQLMAEQHLPRVFSVLYIAVPNMDSGHPGILVYTEWEEDLIAICTDWYQEAGKCINVTGFVEPFDIELTFLTEQVSHKPPMDETTTSETTTEQVSHDRPMNETTTSEVTKTQKPTEEEVLWILIMVGLGLIVAVVLLIVTVVVVRMIRGSSISEDNANESGIYNYPSSSAKGTVDLELEPPAEYCYADVADEYAAPSHYDEVGFPAPESHDSQGQLLPDGRGP